MLLAKRLLMAFAATAGCIGTWLKLFEIDDINYKGSTNDYLFGWTQASNGIYAIFSSEDHSRYNTWEGAIYVYSIATGDFLYKILHPYQAEGNYLLTENSLTCNSNYIACGADNNGVDVIYIFDITDGSLVETITLSGVSNVLNLAMSDDYLLIGDMNYDTGYIGRILRYSTTNWTYINQIDNPTPSLTRFGRRIFIAPNGNFLASSGSGSTGAIYYYETLGTTPLWTKTGGTYYGYSIAVNDAYFAVVSAGSVLIYNNSDGTPYITIAPSSVGISAFESWIGNYLSMNSTYIAAKDGNTQGSVYTFALSDGTPYGEIQFPFEWGFDGSVVLNENGSVILGDPDDYNNYSAWAGAGFIANVDGTMNYIIDDWEQYAYPNYGYDEFGWAVASCAEYTVIVAHNETSEYNAGGDTYNMRYIGAGYVVSNATGETISNLIFNANYDAGYPQGYETVSCATNSNYAVVGAYLSPGGASVFNPTTGELIYNLKSPNVGVDERFGSFVGINDTHVIVGGPRYLSNTGIAYVFKLSDGLLEYTLNNFIAGEGGCLVACNNTHYLVAGLYRGRLLIYNSSGTLIDDKTIGAYTSGISSIAMTDTHYIVGKTISPGTAYVYTIDGTLVHTVTNPNVDTGSTYDNFGFSVAINDTWFAVGAPREDHGAVNYTGAVYIYCLVDGHLMQTLQYWDETREDWLKENEPNGMEAEFGASISLSENYLSIGAPQATVDSGVWGTENTNAGKVFIYAMPGDWKKLHEINNIVSYGGTNDDEFGYELARYGNILAVSAPFSSDEYGEYSGKVHVYDMTTYSLLYTIWNPSRYVDPPEPYMTSGASFGYYGIAVSESYIAVAAPFSWNGTAYTEGDVWIFDITDGSLLHTITRDSSLGTSHYPLWGYSLAMTDTLLLITSWREGYSSNNIGKVWMYNPATGAYIDMIPCPGTDKGFAYRVAINSNNWFVVGHYNDSASYPAYVFDNTGTLQHTFGPYNGLFGTSIDITNDYVFVGRNYYYDTDRYGLIYQYDITTGNEVNVYHNPTTDGRFGTFISASDSYLVSPTDYDTVEEDDRGIVHVYDTSTYALLRSIPNPMPNFVSSTYAWMGVPLICTDDYIAASSLYYNGENGSQEGIVIVLDPTDGSNPTNINNPAVFLRSEYGNFGDAVATSNTHTVVGASWQSWQSMWHTSGAIYIINNTTAEYVWVHPPFETGEETYNLEMGHSVAITSTHVAVGSQLEHTFLYDISGTLLHTFSFTPYASWVGLNDNYILLTKYTDGKGYVYRLSDYGLQYTLDSGTYGVGYRAAACNEWYVMSSSAYDKVWLYNAVGEFERTFIGPAGQYYGFAISVCANYTAVGAMYDDPGGISSAGKVYVYNNNTGALLHEIDNPNPTASDYFGRSVAINNEYLVVGAPGEDGSDPIISYQGAVYIFDCSSGELLQTFYTSDLSTNSIVESQYWWDGLGNAVSISPNSNYICGGANESGPYYDSEAAGKAYILTRL